MMNWDVASLFFQRLVVRDDCQVSVANDDFCKKIIENIHQYLRLLCCKCETRKFLRRTEDKCWQNYREEKILLDRNRYAEQQYNH